MPQTLRVLICLCVSLAVHVAGPSRNCAAQEAASPAASMVNLLKSGRIPPERLGTILSLVCSRGNADDLAFILSEAAKPNHWPADVREAALKGLLTASQERSVKPSGDLAGLSQFLNDPSPTSQKLALQLIGEWKVTSLADVLAERTKSPTTQLPQRAAALDALLSIAPEAGQKLARELVSGEHPLAIRNAALQAIAKSDLTSAAQLASTQLSRFTPRDDLAPLLKAFLDVKDGTKVLATRFEQAAPTQDQARVLLRDMLAVGRTDAELMAVLTRVSGMNQAARFTTPEELAALQQRIAKEGDPARGELVFRRDDLSCLRCHAISKTGGQVGPDLSAVGSISPVEFLIASLLNPDQAIKEGFQTRTVLTTSGRIHQGIAHDRTNDALILKDATSQLISIPIKEIEDEVEGKSLMPKGLVNFMTDAEFADLIAFLSQLGRPGPYAVRTAPIVQRYRLLIDPTPEVLADLRNGEELDSEKLQDGNWQSAYALVNGVLPLAELRRRSHNETLVVACEIQCTEPGEMQLALPSIPGLAAWVDEATVAAIRPAKVSLTAGVHRVTLRIDSAVAESTPIKLEVQRVDGSAARAVPVDGP